MIDICIHRFEMVLMDPWISLDASVAQPIQPSLTPHRNSSTSPSFPMRATLTLGSVSSTSLKVWYFNIYFIQYAHSIIYKLDFIYVYDIMVIAVIIVVIIFSSYHHQVVFFNKTFNRIRCVFIKWVSTRGMGNNNAQTSGLKHKS